MKLKYDEKWLHIIYIFFNQKVYREPLFTHYLLIKNIFLTHGNLNVMKKLIGSWISSYKISYSYKNLLKYTKLINTNNITFISQKNSKVTIYVMLILRIHKLCNNKFAIISLTIRERWSRDLLRIISFRHYKLNFIDRSVNIEM